MTDDQRELNWQKAASRVKEIERLHRSLSNCHPLERYDLTLEERNLVSAMCLTMLDEIRRR